MESYDGTVICRVSCPCALLDPFENVSDIPLEKLDYKSDLSSTPHKPQISFQLIVLVNPPTAISPRHALNFPYSRLSLQPRCIESYCTETIKRIRRLQLTQPDFGGHAEVFEL